MVASKEVWEQLQLAQAQAAGENYAPTRQRVIAAPETGVCREVTVPKRVRPWWFVAENGKGCLSAMRCISRRVGETLHAGNSKPVTGLPSRWSP